MWTGIFKYLKGFQAVCSILDRKNTEDTSGS